MKRLRGSRGATGAEYALIFSLVVVVSIGAIDFLSDRASDETQNQAECVSTRPPPPGCQLEPAIPPQPSPGPTPPGPTPPGPTPPGPTPPPDPCESGDPPAVCLEPTTSSTAPLPPPNVPTFPEPGSTTQGGQWIVTPSITIVDAGGAPVAGAVVRFQIKSKNPNPPPEFYPTAGYVECVTDAAGTCNVPYTVEYGDAPSVVVEVYSIHSQNGAANPLPGGWEVPSPL